MKIFQKIWIFGMIAGTLLLAFGIVKVNAISYDGLATYSVPDIYTSGSALWGQYTTTNSSQDFSLFGQQYNCNIANTFEQDRIVFVPIDNSSGNLLSQGYFYSVTMGNDLDRGYFDLSKSGSKILVDLRRGGTTLYTDTFDFSGQTSSGLSPHQFVMMFHPYFLSVSSGIDVGTYLYSYDYALYNQDTAQFQFETVYFTGTTTPRNQYGIKLTALYSATTATLALQGYTYDWKNHNPFGSYKNFSPTSVCSVDVALSHENYEMYHEFLMYTGAVGSGNWVYRSLPNYYGSVGLLIPTNTGSTGTDYFATCGNFLDVGCYIQGFWNGVSNTISGWFSSLFPDISFSGTSSTCLYATGSSSGATSFLSGSSTYFSKVADMFKLLVPLPPQEGEQYCIFGGSGVATMRYRRATTGADYFSQTETSSPDSVGPVDYLLILSFSMMFLFYFYALAHKHKEDA